MALATKMAELKEDAKELHDLLKSNTNSYLEYMNDEDKLILKKLTTEINRIRKALSEKIKNDEGKKVPRPTTKEYYNDIKTRLRVELKGINNLFDPYIEAAKDSEDEEDEEGESEDYETD